MKKILYIITQSEFGGAQRYVFDLATSLNGEFEITVAAGENRGGELFQRFANLKKSDLTKIKTVYLKHLKRSINPWHDILAFFEIKRLVKKERPDIVHLNSTKAGILGSLAARSAAGYQPSAILYTAHGWVFNEPLGRYKKKIYLWLEKFTAKYKDKIICVSEYDRKIAVKLGFPAKKIITIYNGIDADNLDFLPKETARNALSAKITLNPLFKKEKENHSTAQPLNGSTTQIIGTIANLYKTKGIEYLIKAADILCNSYFMRHTAFIVIGDGGEKEKLKTLIQRHNVQNNFFLAGNIPEARKYIKAFDVFVLPSVKEGLPYAILEAMAAGTPVVATKTGGVPEIIRHFETGLLAEAGSPDDLAKKISEFLTQPRFGEIMAQEGLLRLKEIFSLQKMIEQTKKAYCG
jgi:glycosyltransferase involved in cell wall biosynthesis